MNDVMTDNHRCPHTEYTIFHLLSISVFVEIMPLAGIDPTFSLRFPVRGGILLTRAKSRPGFPSTGKELTL